MHTGNLISANTFQSCLLMTVCCANTLQAVGLLCVSVRAVAGEFPGRGPGLRVASTG